ncbi:MAG: HlyD family secretion protein [Proteobacteria bacterium]|nr:HlyD family secretion protein [Pseudomonadota bacterium]
MSNAARLAPPEDPANASATAEAPPRPRLVPPAEGKAEGKADGGQADAAVAAAPPKRSRRRLVMGLFALLLLGAGGYYGHEWYTVGRFEVSTNDAYVKADTSVIGAKIAGYVAAVPVEENVRVRKGEVILSLDKGDYELAVAAASQKIATQQALLDSFDAQRNAQEAQVASTQARLDGSNAEEANAASAMKRTAALLRSNVVAKQTEEDAVTRHDSAVAAVNVATAGLSAAQAQLAVIEAGRKQAEAQMAELQTALAKAERDLSFTDIQAPFDGIVANRAVEPGQYVQGGTRLMALVPADAAFVEANYKETQLPDIHAGQAATVIADAFPGQSFKGVIASISPASGAEFSLLPPENATGNFTKITQRYSVKVKLPPEAAALLQPGLSVTVTVDSRDTGTKG